MTGLVSPWLVVLRRCSRPARHSIPTATKSSALCLWKSCLRTKGPLVRRNRAFHPVSPFQNFRSRPVEEIHVHSATDAALEIGKGLHVMVDSSLASCVANPAKVMLAYALATRTVAVSERLLHNSPVPKNTESDDSQRYSCDIPRVDTMERRDPVGQCTDRGETEESVFGPNDHLRPSILLSAESLRQTNQQANS